MTETLPPQLQLLVREYGHNTYQLAQTLLTLEDRAERTKRAQQVVQLMFRLNPGVREQQDYQHKLWNHLYAMTGNQLDVDAPFPLTGLDQFNQKPKPLAYPSKAPKLRPYGKNVEELIAKATEIEDATEREQAALSVGRVMKFLYRMHSKDVPKDVTILKHLKDLSGGKLVLDINQLETLGGLDTIAGAAPAGAGRGGAFVVQQPRAERGDREQRRGGGKNDRRDKRRGKKGGRDQQQPPQ
ncbi:DUF4290 domain-containing protein [Hymenobacter latericus]|uniref:DUF4290 domain-containing protein n=1 Tax=Hymenobacter sp. YIM 151858-1 TaxID=2987688 RepID=UPI002226DE75|nr:DUF4290 domain-containing protein [Hymenobacter sp. YIM 151858-1]UYZ60520.1 DUF4290 domain-containing protein [Hymenobacter sp. YIM 151858-1]